MEFLPCVFFHLRRKGFLHKYLYFCVWLLFWIDNIDGNIIWDVIVVSKLGWFSGWLFVWIKMKEKGLLWLRWSYPKTPFGWSENRKDRKGRVENKEENDVFPCLVQERKHKGWKILGKKNPPGPTNIYSPDLGGKVGRKMRKVGLALELHIYPLDVLYVNFFSFLFYYGNLRLCDLWVRSLTPCHFFRFFSFFYYFIIIIIFILFNSFLLCL